MTAVDLATQDVILLVLRRMLPDVAIDAEEDTETVHLFAPPDGRPLVVIDPVDGTLNYARGSSDYAVMGSLVREGRVTAAVVYFPQWRELYWAAQGRGCWRERETGTAPPGAEVGGLGLTPPERVRLDGGAAGTGGGTPPGNVVLVSPGTSRGVRSDLENEGFEVHVSRCSAVDSCAPATGRAAAALTTRPADRRRALGLLTTLEAGGAVRCARREWRGEDVEEGLRPPCIAAQSHALAERIEAIASKRL